MEKKSKRSSLPPFSCLIEKKRDCEELTDEEIRFITDAVYDRKIPEHQLAAFLMSVFFQGMTVQEVAVWTQELMLSGDVIDLKNISQPLVDRCSTGGVGDKSSFILIALAAACGISVPSLVNDEDGLIISDIQKLQSIPGFSVDHDMKSFKLQVKKIGCCYYKQYDSIATIDSYLMKIRKEIGAISSVPLITGSILSRKLSTGIEGLVVDVKWGSGSFVRDVEQAKQLGRMITRVAKALNRKCVALVTNASQPIGSTVGTSLEVKEAIELLQGKGDPELQDLILRLGMEIVRIAGVAGSTLSAKQMVTKKLSDGSALQKFKELIAAQGGDVSFIDNPEKFPKAKHVKKLVAQKRGYVHTVNAGMIARGVQLLSQKEDGTTDYAVGVSDIMKVGLQVKQGEPLIMIHYNDETNLEQALDYFRSAYRLAPKRPVQQELIEERIA